MEFLEQNEALRRRLSSYSEIDTDYWSFRGKAVREHAHAYFQYPAMMVPQMQGKLIQSIREVSGDLKSVFDPFVGSGTIMTEAMMQGLDFIGQDINPLAVLLCRAKLGPFHARALGNKITALLERVQADQAFEVEANFPTLYKWFSQHVAIDLSRLKRAIRAEKSLWARRFFWVALAETVRLSSNSRISTFKLHIRDSNELAERKVFAIQVFTDIISRNFERFLEQKSKLEERNLVRAGHYQGNISIKLKDSRRAQNSTDHHLHDFLITSPPYGDNGTTVPYGQHSFLPLHWIDLEDIDKTVTCDWLATSSEIDRRSLGGSLCDALNKFTLLQLQERSPSFKRTIDCLSSEPRDRAARVTAFCRDLDHCLRPILEVLKPNAYMLWTVGNRRVSGQLIPVDDILSELLNTQGAELIHKIQRTIPTKRMAIKNRVASTMRAETILIMRKSSVS